MKASAAVLAWSRDPAAPLPPDLAEPLASALADAKPILVDAGASRFCVQVLSILEALDCDAETLAACVRFAALQALANGPEPEWLTTLSATQLRLIDGQRAAEKVWTLHAQRAGSSGVEGLRRLLLAIIGDLRVVFILLARQLARLRAARTLPDDERRALAQLSADIHAPLANRLGIWQLKWELEDLAFSYHQPSMYQRIVRLLDERKLDRDRFIGRCLQALRSGLAGAGIDADLAGRAKHIYSIWRKMQRKGLAFSELYDIRAVRILVEDVPSCYAALGVVHGLWPHIPQEFDDYIARPKVNGYKSLHTAVQGPDGKTLEVQIRTRDMHQANELGVAAHWRYKEGGGSDAGFEAKVAWMRRLLEPRADDDGGNDDAALLAGFRTDLLEDRVYLLTPKGQVLDLPHGATVLDFAYHIHTDVGHRCRGAKVNGRIVPLVFQPQTGDRIEVLVGKERDPSRDWLSGQQVYLNTARAREKVRSWFRRSDHAANLAAGQILFDRELKRIALANAEPEKLPAHFNLKTQDELLVALALGEVTSGQIARALQESQAVTDAPEPTLPRRIEAPQNPGALTIEGVGNLLTVLARCCQPLPGDAVQGFITRGRGVSVHRHDCKALARLRQRDADRVIDVQWGDAPARAYHVDIVVRGYDRKGLQKDVVAVISNSGAHIVASSSHAMARSAEVDMRFTLKVSDYGQLSTLLARVGGLPNVLDARRMAGV
ncbi:MAG: bifunctional (p)ppGpp synthetase/guanosine-3',5'-bis(diphosphate) 3'-pyrophosphohydrolase [Xanthomonadales bacterium]|nr:bifunctional (p)ppGpp synthetase/guanosine-3',5'-bis(diphosphate) 3'-pyrophosphohydrolase [Xanthomonadales bacterium]